MTKTEVCEALEWIDRWRNSLPFPYSKECLEEFKRLRTLKARIEDGDETGMQSRCPTLIIDWSPEGPDWYKGRTG